MKKNKYSKIATKSAYDELLKSGMFYELFPELTGIWKEDNLTIIDNILNNEIFIVKVIQKFRYNDYEHNIIFYGDKGSYSYDEIESTIDDYVNNVVYYDWDFITDIIEINRILSDNCIKMENEKKDIDKKINILTNIYNSL